MPCIGIILTLSFFITVSTNGRCAANIQKEYPERYVSFSKIFSFLLTTPAILTARQIVNSKLNQLTKSLPVRLFILE